MLLIIFLVFILLFLIFFEVWLYQLKKYPNNVKKCQNSSEGWQWADNCLSIKELKYDPTLKSPKNIKPYLVDFSYSAGAGLPIYRNVWYRFRYVNVKTGDYSDFSDWTSSPIISGGKNFPCDGTCGFNTENTCYYNQPVIGIPSDTVEYSPYNEVGGTYIYMNLHRYISENYLDSSKPSPNVKDEIVGILISKVNESGKTYFTWTDVAEPVCGGKRECSTPSWC